MDQGGIVIVNPTEEQLRTLRGLIYAIRHRTSGRHYVGQTARSFIERYRCSRWWNQMHNRFLKRSVTKYGKEAFDILILEHGVKTRDELNRLEAEWATKLKCYHPHGFNFNPCGDVLEQPMSEEIRKIRGAKHAKTYRFKEAATGKVIEVTNLEAFCRKRGLSTGTLRNVIKNKRLGSIAYGFCSLESAEYDVKNLGLLMYQPQLRAPFHLWKRGVEHIVWDCEEFISKHRLTRYRFVCLLSGKSDRYRGFTRRQYLEKVPGLYAWVKLWTPDNQIVHITRIREFQQSLKPINVGVHSLIRGEYKQSHGYRLHSYRLK